MIRSRHRGSYAAGAVVTAAALAVISVPGTAQASSHREAPLTSALPQYDNTDVYAFNTGTPAAKSVTLIANWIPFEEPAGGPNFYPWATDGTYDINIDQNADAKADIVYRYTFRNVRTPGPANSFAGSGTFLYNNGPVTSPTDDNLLFRQAYTLTKIVYNRNGSVRSSAPLFKDRPVAPSYVGTASMGTPEQYKANIRDKSVSYLPAGAPKYKSFAGQADDSFFLDLRVFNLLYGGDLSEVGNDTLAGYNVNSVALEVPVSEFTRNGKAIIGVWSSTSIADAKGKLRQVSRLGSPLVNEVVVPYRFKDAFNASIPSGDAQFAGPVLNPELPKIVEALYKIPAPAAPRNDLVQAFLTGVPGLNQPKGVVASEMLRLNVTPFAGQTTNRLGVIGGDLNGFPNGRRLTDDVLDAEVQVAQGVLLPNHPKAIESLGDGVNVNDVPFTSDFPYLAIPHSGSHSLKGAAAKNSNSSLHPTLLTGGNTDTLSGSGAPVGELAAGGFGLLLLVGAAAAVRRRGGVRPLSPSPATA